MLLVRAGEGIVLSPLRVNDDGTMNRGPQPGYMRVPEERAPLVVDGEPVRVRLTGLNRTLRHVRRTIGPARQRLKNSMPDMQVAMKLTLF